MREIVYLTSKHQLTYFGAKYFLQSSVFGELPKFSNDWDGTKFRTHSKIEVVDDIRIPSGFIRILSPYLCVAYHVSLS